MSKDTILHKHCRVYLQTFRAHSKRNLHPYYCHRRADAEADRLFHLTPEEKKRRDAEWLSKQAEFKGWDKEPDPDRGQRVFDDENVMRAE